LSQLAPLLSKLKESGAERVFFAPGELGYAYTGDQKKPMPGGPTRPATIVEAIAELLSHDELRELPNNRPRIVRHEHEGADYVLEIVRQSSGIALGIRFGQRAPVRAPKDSFREPRDAPRESPREAPPREAAKPTEQPASKPKSASRRFRPSQRPPPPAAAAAPSADKRTVRVDLDEQGHPNDSIPIELDLGSARSPRTAEPRSEARREPAPAPEPAPKTEPSTARSATGENPVLAAAAMRVGPPRIDDLLREMVQKRASDLHLSAGSMPVMRIDGEIHFLKDKAPLSGEAIMGLVREIMSEKARGDFESLHDADFAHEISGLARFRVNVFEDRRGTGAVFRQIPAKIVTAEELGLPKACLDLCWLSKGLVVVTGPTGSGKSTTLASMVDFINRNRSDHIITIEDPVEFVHQNQKCLVNQREVGSHTKSFKNALRAALREDPDIVLVGEMRDLETIAIAIETAETGHLVFGTLHTTTAVSTVDRIVDQFPSDRQAQIRVMLSESLKGVIAQILCPKIGGGRVAAHEILLGTSAVAAIIRDGKTFQLPSIMQTSKQAGMVTMNDALMQLVQRRLVDPKQAYIKAVDKNGLLAMFKAQNIPTNFL
jgi:twitching motility protein PilT